MLPKSKQKDSTYKPANYFSVKSRYNYLNQSHPDTITRSRFMWYPLKTIDNLLDYLPGYNVGHTDVGQLQNLRFNQLENSYTGLFRHGRPLNDLIDGTADFDLFSRNEISEIEFSNGTGDFLYDYANGINVLERQIVQNRPYSEISFWQDRYENLYFDANYHQNFFRKLNFNFGMTKHSYDGNFTNSDFDKWLGRFNFNLAVSNKVNTFLYINYSKVQRGLNDGINPDTLNYGIPSEVFDPSIAVVKNSDAYEMRERFDIDAGAVFLTSKDSLSFFRVQAFTSNATRKYRDEENRPNPNGIFYKENNHWIDYGIRFQNMMSAYSSKSVKIRLNSEAEYDYDIIQYNIQNVDNLNSNRIFLMQQAMVDAGPLAINAYIKAFRYKYFSNDFFSDLGATVNYVFRLKNDNSFSVFGDYMVFHRIWTYAELLYGFTAVDKGNMIKAGANYKTSQLSLNAEGYYITRLNNGFHIAPNVVLFHPGLFYNNAGINTSWSARLWKFDIEGKYTYNFKDRVGGYTAIDRYEPEHSGNLNISFHDLGFKNKLEYKIGVTSRFWSRYKVQGYDGYSNLFYYTNIETPPSATFDFYLIARINKATFGLTFENLLNRVVYNTALYPYMDRGGLANVISRFNITWYFLN